MNKTILFLCPHNAAKSVIAAADFDQLARQAGLPFVADSAGSEPDAAVSPAVVSLLAREGLDVSQHQPRQITPDDLRGAHRIIALGCTPDEMGLSAAAVEVWPDIPAVSQEPERARRIIRAHVQMLIDELRAAQ